MNEGLFQSLFTGVFSIILLIMWVIIPFVSRNDIFLGIRIPEDKMKSKEIAEIKKQFIIACIVIGLVYSAITSYIVYGMNKTNFALFSLITVFLYLFIQFIIYYIYNRKTAALKRKSGWIISKKQVVAVDTKFTMERSKSYIVSSLWFLIPLLIIVATIMVNAIMYPDIPKRVPMHYDFNGAVTEYQAKSRFLIFEMPLVELFLTVVMFLSNKVIGWSKQEIDPQRPEESKQRNILFRRAWSIYLLLTNILLNMLFSLGDLQIINVIKINGIIMLPVVFAVVGVMIIWAIYLSVKYGQGGSKLKLQDATGNDSISNRDDDKNWILGNTIYYNPNDPSIFVEKRVGIGWTINAGSLVGKIIYIALILLVVGSILLPVILSMKK